MGEVSAASPAGGPRVTAVRVGPAGESLYLGTAAGEVEIVSLVTGDAEGRLAGGEAAPVLSLAADPGRRRVLAGHGSGRLRVWDTPRSEVTATLTAEEPLIAVLAPEGAEHAALGGRRTPYLWQVDEEGRVRGGAMVDLAGSPLLADDLASPHPDHWVLRKGFGWYLWQLDRLRLAGQAPDREGAAVAGRTGELVRPVDPRGLVYDDGCVGLSACGRVFYTYWDDFLLFDVRSGRELHRGPTPHHAIAAHLTAGARRLALGTAEGEVIVTTAKGREVSRARPTAGRIRSLHMDAAGRVVAWRDHEGRAGVLDGAAGREILTADQVAAIVARAADRAASEPSDG